MTEPNFRALCAEIYQEFSSLYCDMSACVDFNDSYMERIDNLCNRADAALATVPPEQKNSIDELIAGCKPLDPEMAEALTTEARWRLFGEDDRAELATTPPEAPPTPDLSALAAIGERLRTQDNRCTAHPAFQVRGLRRIYGMDLDYADEPVWIDNGSDCIEVDPPEDPENPGDFIIKTGYQDHWEIIMVAFSEQACLDYIKHNGYRHGVYRELEVYADSFYRCPEMLAIREALMALPGESAPPPKPPTDEELLRLYGVATPCYHVEEFKRELDFVRAALERWGQ